MLLIAVFIGALITPVNNDWAGVIHNLFTGHGWQLDNGCIIKQVVGADIRQQLAAAVDPVMKAHLTKKLYLVAGTKFLLLAVFAGIGVLVYIAGKRREKAAMQQ